MSNKPPDVSLELTHDEATFLLNNCNTNMRLGLMLLQNVRTRETGDQIVAMLEHFKSIREKLRKAGARDPEDE